MMYYDIKYLMETTMIEKLNSMSVKDLRSLCRLNKCSKFTNLNKNLLICYIIEKIKNSKKEHDKNIENGSITYTECGICFDKQYCKRWCLCSFNICNTCFVHLQSVNCPQCREMLKLMKYKHDFFMYNNEEIIQESKRFDRITEYRRRVRLQSQLDNYIYISFGDDSSTDTDGEIEITETVNIYYPRYNQITNN